MMDIAIRELAYAKIEITKLTAERDALHAELAQVRRELDVAAGFLGESDECPDPDCCRDNYSCDKDSPVCWRDWFTAQAEADRRQAVSS
jgi:hypothetical protein